jgi:hypothetical protein
MEQVLLVNGSEDHNAELSVRSQMRIGRATLMVDDLPEDLMYFLEKISSLGQLESKPRCLDHQRRLSTRRWAIGKCNS